MYLSELSDITAIRNVVTVVPVAIGDMYEPVNLVPHARFNESARKTLLVELSSSQ